MKIMRRLMGCAAAILALSACSESEDLLSAFHSDPNAVRITAQVGKASADGFTRSNPLGTAKEQANFNVNDEISVKADDQDAVTYKLVAVGNKKEWQPQAGKFLKWESDKMNFTAYYPASFNGTITQPTGMFEGCTKLSTVTMLAPSDQITSASDCCKDWLTNAGTDESVLSLIIKNYEAHKALKDKSYLPDNWKDAQYIYTTVE